MRENKSARYPWRSHDINSGVLERLHLDYLLAHDARLMSYSISSLPELGPESLDALDAIFARFRPYVTNDDDKKSSDAQKKRTNWCHAFITGTSPLILIFLHSYLI